MISRKRWSGTYTRTSQRTGFCKSTSKNRLDGYTKCGEAGSGRRDGPHTEASFKDVAYCVSYAQWPEMKTCNGHVARRSASMRTLAAEDPVRVGLVASLA